MTRHLFAGLAAAVFAMALPATAQDADPEGQDDSGEIVVEGDRIDRGAAAEQARDITSNTGGWGDPLPRFQQPVCPGVWGLEPANAQDVIDRIYDNAERAGVPVSEEADCGANLWVIFVDDPHATFEELRRDNSFMVRYLSNNDRDRAARQEGPALAWSVVTTRNREGQVISTGNVSPSELPTNPVTLMTRGNSAVRRDIEMSVVLIERGALAELDAYSVADYATMRALARTVEPHEAGPFGTVLALFDQGSDRMTEFDLAYLQDLYSSRATQPGRQLHGRVAALMERALRDQQ